jgi:hypothetical protein
MDLKKVKWEYDCDGREIEYPEEMERKLKEYYKSVLAGEENNEMAENADDKA